MFLTFLLYFCEVEAYNLVSNEWTLRAPLNKEKGSLAGATLNGKIFALGGGNGIECFSDVDMFDLDVGRWIPTRSMLQKVTPTNCLDYLCCIKLKNLMEDLLHKDKRFKVIYLRQNKELIQRISRLMFSFTFQHEGLA